MPAAVPKDIGSRPDSTPAEHLKPLERLKIVAAALLVLFLLGVAWKRAARALASDEERIRARLEEMTAAFDDTTLRGVLAGFHDDYRDAGSGDGREEVRDALRYLFFQTYGADGADYTVEIPPDELIIDVDPEGETARVALRAVFHRSRAGERETWWDARAVMRWTSAGGRWRILETSEVNHRDRGR